MATEQFINDVIVDRVEQADYTIALLAEMNSAKQSFDALDFATEHMTDESASQYLDYLEDKGLAMSFEKDTQYIKNRIKRVRIQFRTDISILAHPDAFNEHVTVDEQVGGTSRVTIEDTITKFEGR